MSGYWLRREDDHLSGLAGRGFSVRNISCALGRTVADVTNRLQRLGYDISDVGIDVRRRVVAMRKAKTSVIVIAKETELEQTQVIRISALRQIPWIDAPPPPELQVDPWDRPRPAGDRSMHGRPATTEWPF